MVSRSGFVQWFHGVTVSHITYITCITHSRRLEPVDVRGLALHDLVDFKGKEVEVHVDRPGGRQLNTRARILLEGVYPKAGKGGAVDRDRFYDKIWKRTMKFGGTLTRYDPDAGEWEFEVDNLE